MMLKTIFVGVVLAVTAVGTAAAKMPDDGTNPNHPGGVASGAVTGCTSAPHGWSPRTLKVGERSGHIPDAMIGTDNNFERRAAVRDCALV